MFDVDVTQSIISTSKEVFLLKQKIQTLLHEFVKIEEPTIQNSCFSYDNYKKIE